MFYYILGLTIQPPIAKLKEKRDVDIRTMILFDKPIKNDAAGSSPGCAGCSVFGLQIHTERFTDSGKLNLLMVVRF